MVGAGEVDEDLEGETKEECEKYGKVAKCVIFEVGIFMENTFSQRYTDINNPLLLCDHSWLYSPIYC